MQKLKNNFKLKMNKYSILLFAICVISFVASKEDSHDYFGVFISLIKGFSDQKESTCVKVLLDNEKALLGIVDDAFSLLDKGESGRSILSSIAFKLLAINNLATECNILGLPLAYNKLMSDEGKAQLLQNGLNNCITIFKHLLDFIAHLENDDVNGLAEDLGKILSIVFEFKTNP